MNTDTTDINVQVKSLIGELVLTIAALEARNAALSARLAEALAPVGVSGTFTLQPPSGNCES